MTKLKDRFAAVIARVEAAWGGKLVPTSLLTLVAAVYSYAYWTHYAVPVAGTFPEHSGWWERHDPQKYRDQAEALSRFALDADTHHYPIGYAATAAPFAWIDPQHAFFVPDLAFVLVMTGMLYLLGRRFMGQVESAAMVIGAAVATSPLLYLALIIPRSTIATTALGYAMLTLLVYRKPTPALVYQLVVLDGLTYLTRPGDAFFLSPLLVVAVLQLRDWKSRIVHGGAGVAVLSLFLGLTRLINQSVTREAVSFYEQKHRAGFTFGRLFETFYFTYLDGAPVYRDDHWPLLAVMPWVLLVLPGVAYAAKKDSWRQLAVFGTLLGSLFFYVAYWNMDPVGLWTYHLVRYVTWAFPVLFLFAWLSVRFAFWQLDKRLVAALTLVPVLFAWTVRLEEADPLPVEVHADGTVTPLGEVHPGGYDLIVARRPSFRGSGAVSVDGVPLMHDRDMHKRRNYRLRTSLRGVILFLNDKVAPDQLTLADNLAGTPVELRRLTLRFEPLPPALRRWLTGDTMWGTDSLDFTANARFDGEGDVVLKQADLGEATIIAASWPEMGRGRYELRLRGRSGSKHKAELRVTRNQRTVLKKPLAISNRDGELAVTRFKLDGNARTLGIRIVVAEGGADLKAEEIELAPAP